MKSLRLISLLFWTCAIGAAQTNVADTRPQSISQPAPAYPPQLREQRVVGSANLSFLIDAQGTVKDIRVDWASHEAFGVAAVEAVAKWKYQPATKGGQPVALRVAVPLSFGLTSAELVELEARRVKETLPPGPPVLEVEAVDEWPELKKEIRPKTPQILRETRRMGQAVIAMIVDEEGVPRDIHAIMVTRPECGVEAMAAIAKWRFVPGRVAGQAVRVAIEVPVAFFPEAV